MEQTTVNQKKKLRLRLVFLYIGSFIASVAPLLAVLAWKWEDYTKTPGETVKLCIGGVIVLFFIFLKVIGKLKMPRLIVLFGIVFVMAYLLQALLNDLILLSGMALVGEFVDFICFQHFIRVTKENLIVEKTADATAVKVEEAIKRHFNGRT